MKRTIIDLEQFYKLDITNDYAMDKKDKLTEQLDNEIIEEYNLDKNHIYDNEYILGTDNHKNYIDNEIKSNDIIFVVSDCTYKVIDNNKLLNLFDNKTIIDKSELFHYDFFVVKAN